MSETLQARAETIKLSRLLAVDEGELDFLESLPSAATREVREKITRNIFDSSAEMLGRVGAAAKLLPSALIAKIAVGSFGPLLCARAAGAVDVDKALDVCSRLPAAFLADATIEVDPRRVARIIARVPEELVVPVAAELGRRREYVTMGRFLAFVPDHAIGAAMSALDEEAMIRTAFVLEHKDRLDHAIGILPPERLPDVLRQASRLGVWPEALDLLDHLSEERRGPIADVVAEQDPGDVAELVRAVAEAELWDSLLPVIRQMSPNSRVAFAAMPAFHEREVLRGIIRAAAAQGLWIDLVPLIDALPAAVRGTVPSIAAEIEPELLTKVLRDAVEAPHTFPSLISLLVDLPDDGTTDALDRIAAALHQDDVVAVTRAAIAAGVVEQLLPVYDALPAHVRTTTVLVIERADVAMARAFVEAFGDGAALAGLLDRVPPELLTAIRVGAQRNGLEGELDAALASATS